MEIIGSPTSPYVRIVRALAAELSLEYDFVEMSSMVNGTKEELMMVEENNPLQKIPILRIGDQRIFDSRIIMNYMIEQAELTNLPKQIKTERSLEDENNLTILYGVGDAILLLFVMGKTYPDADHNVGYLKRSRRRIHSALKYLDAQKDLGEEFDLTSLVAVCILAFLTATEVEDWSQYTNLKALFDKYKTRPSLVSVGVKP